MEKFALLNLLKALETLSPPDMNRKNAESMPPAAEAQEPPQRSEPAAPRSEAAAPKAYGNDFNAMASVLSRHEQISNRLRNKK